MSYAPIYNKLRELEERVALVETAPKATGTDADYGITIGLPLGLTSTTDTDLVDELNKIKTEFNNLLKECSINSSAITQLSTDLLALSTAPAANVTDATKEELAALATKEEVAALATKEEVAALATKEELAALATKEEVAALATKEEVAALATKEEVAALATKEEVAALATKEEVADIQVKFDNVINVISQLNAKINEANEKISALEDN